MLAISANCLEHGYRYFFHYYFLLLMHSLPYDLESQNTCSHGSI